MLFWQMQGSKDLISCSVTTKSHTGTGRWSSYSSPGSPICSAAAQSCRVVLATCLSFFFFALLVKEQPLVWTRIYSITCLHIHRLFPKGGHQHWFFPGMTFGL